MQCPPELSQRAIALKPSLTLEISAKAKALQNEGRDICSLSAGEPDFNTPDFITQAAREALANGMTRYGPAAGDPELREAIAQKLTQENGCPTTEDQVLVTNGGKQAIYNLFQVLLNPGDEVLIPAPFWLSYPEMAALAGAASVIVPTSASAGFALDLDRLERSITPKTRLLVLNSPGNPTGRVASLDELKALAELLRRHPRVLVMSDEIYEYLLAEGEVHHSFASVAEDLRHRCFTVNGFAKGWAMTGWRLGVSGRPCSRDQGRCCPAEPEHQQCLQLCPTGRFGRAAGLPRLRPGHGLQLQQAPNLVERRSTRDRWHHPREAPGGLLRLPPVAGSPAAFSRVLQTGPRQRRTGTRPRCRLRG